jgi:DNA ligase-1
MENITYQFPDIVKYILTEVKPSAKEFILEAEIIPLGKDGQHLNFQTLMQRKRKTDIEKYVEKIPVNLYCFDLLYLNGKDITKETYPTRTKKLNSIISGKNLKMTESIFTENISEVEEFFNKCLKEGYEGIIVKSQTEDSSYKAGARDWNWIKWKQDYMTDVVDTLDLVIVGAFYGKGKRSGNYGSLLCATYNSENDTFETITKLGTGMTDKTLAELPILLDKHKVDKKPARVIAKKEMYPDVWFEPSVVVEVLSAEITRGNMHTCSKIDGKGLALRFPRFIMIRENKSAEQANTSQELQGLHEK